MHVTVLLLDVLRVRLVPLPPPPCVSVVSLSVSPDDGSGTSSRAVEIGLFIEYLTNLLGVVCVGVELAVVFVLLGFSQQVSH